MEKVIGEVKNLAIPHRPQDRPLAVGSAPIWSDGAHRNNRLIGLKPIVLMGHFKMDSTRRSLEVRIADAGPDAFIRELGGNGEGIDPCQNHLAQESAVRDVVDRKVPFIDITADPSKFSELHALGERKV